MTLREYLVVFRERWVVVVACVVVGVLIALVVTLLTPRQYASESTFYIATQGGETDASSAYDATLLAREKMASYVELLSDPRVGDDVAGRLGDVDASTVSGSITAAAVPDTSLIRTTVTAGSPEQAQRIAGAVAEEFVVLVAQLEAQLQAPPPGVDPTPTVVARVVRPPSYSASAVSPSVPYDIGLGLVAGLVVGLLGALVWHQLDNTVKSADVLGRVVGAPPLGAVVEDPSFAEHPVGVHENPRSAHAEAYRHVRTNLGFLGVDTPSKVLVGTSPLPDEAKTATLCNLAAVLGQEGYRTLLVSADLRRPRVETYLGVESAVGLTTILMGRATIDDCVQPWGGGAFDVLATGKLPPNPSEMLGSRKMTELVTELRDRYDIVVLDAPPLLPVTDAAVLGARSDGIILMGRHGKSTKNDLARAVSRLRSADVAVVGTILTRAPESQLRTYQSYLAIEPSQPPEPSGPSEPGAAAGAPGEASATTTPGVTTETGSDDEPVTEERSFAVTSADAAPAPAEERVRSSVPARRVPSPRPRVPLVPRSTGDGTATAVEDKP